MLWESEVNATAVRGTDFDAVDVGGDLAFNDSTAVQLVFNGVDSAVDWTDAFWDTSKTGTSGWLVYDVAGTTTNFPNLGITVQNWADSNSVLFNTARPGSSFDLILDGNDIYLNYLAAGAVVIPEPGTLFLTGVAGLGLMLRRRRNG